ncbi:putative ADP-ribosylation factor-like 2, arl2 [Trypanosoma vivax]|nr:putative ADP-ribosylation factor-like 2, arl2 [Trypanosoma vivax]
MEQSPPSQGNVMGVVRCAAKRGRPSFLVYKKRFLVVDEAQGRLEVYKNDQEPFSLEKFPVSELRGVIISGGKQSKFYGLTLQLRHGRSVRFRLKSVEERDNWYAVITRLIERYSTYNRDNNILRVAQRRSTAAGRSLGVSITLATAKLSEIPDDLLQYLVEAVDVAINTISVVVHKYGGDMVVPRCYVLIVDARSDNTLVGPQYDPTTGSLVLRVWISRDILGGVHFNVADPEEIMKVTLSHVWRDPRIEGWITANPSCMAICKEIGDLLGIKSFSLSFQWGQNLRETKTVEQYLHQYVHDDFLRAIQRQIVEVAEDFKRPDTFSDGSLYLKYIGDYVSGIAIVLDESTVNAGKPPGLCVTNTIEYHRRCRTAVVLSSKYFEAYRQPRPIAKSLRDQLMEIIFLAELNKQLWESKNVFSQFVAYGECVRVMWTSLLRAAAQVGAPLLQRKLPELVTSLTDLYLARLESLQQLYFADQSYGDIRPLSVTLFSNVSAIVVDFVPFVNEGMQLPEPRVHQGILTDYIVCCTSEQQHTMMRFIRHSRAMPQVDRAYVLLKGLLAFPSMPVSAFKEWCGKHLLNLEREKYIDDHDDSSSYSSSPSVDVGDTVAYERNAEAQVLDLHRVVSTIYDSQGASVHLKVGADSIREAIHSLESAFGGRHIRKHDLVRILTLNLRRLRIMYTQTIGGEATGQLDIFSAIELLKSLCEYEENEYEFEKLLRHYLQTRHTVSRTGTDLTLCPNRPSSPTKCDRIYDFQCVSHVVLNHVLPREMIVARRAWRVGLVVGLQDVGKTLIINSLRGVVQPTFPTVGLSQQVVAFQEWVIAMKELGGRESFRDNWLHYVERMEEVNFLFFVVDSMNKRSFKDVSSYLQAITDHFPEAPLVVIFNNVPANSHVHQLLEQLTKSIKLDKVRRRNPMRTVIIGVCDITVVSSSHRHAPSALVETMEKLSCELRRASPVGCVASQPKQGANAEAIMRNLSSSMALQL